MALRATEVFTPGAFPIHTYVERAADGLEQALRDALDTPGQVVSLSGPSKSGKTVLVEKVVGRDELITIPGAGITTPEQIWDRVLDWIEVPEARSRGTAVSASAGTGATGKASASLFGLAKTEGEVTGDLGVGTQRETVESFGRAGLMQVVKEIANSDYVVLIDDFHYMPREVQVEAAKSLKEAVRLNIKICTASVRHRGDDVVRANPELRGRVRAIDLRYWQPQELQRIAESGFDKLNASIDPSVIQKLTSESAGSPQLMQLLCLTTCFVLGVREKALLTHAVTSNAEQLQQVLEQTASNTDFRSLIDVLDAGPKTRGTERKTYRFKDNTEGDVYRCVLKAVASDPPRLSFQYDDLMNRTSRICFGDSPVGSSVVGTAHHMARLALEKFPNERAIDWDEQKQILDIPDPYLLFYLRWSGRLQEQ